MKKNDRIEKLRDLVAQFWKKAENDTRHRQRETAVELIPDLDNRAWTLSDLSAPPALRVLVWREKDTYVAQVLEYDICTQAPVLSQLMKRVAYQLSAEHQMAANFKRPLFAAYGPPPARFAAMWDASADTAHTTTEGRLTYRLLNKSDPTWDDSV